MILISPVCRRLTVLGRAVNGTLRNLVSFDHDRQQTTIFGQWTYRADILRCCEALPYLNAKALVWAFSRHFREVPLKALVLGHHGQIRG